MSNSGQSEGRTIGVGTKVRERHPVFYAPIAIGEVVDADEAGVLVEWGGNYTGTQYVERDRIGRKMTDLICIDDTSQGRGV